MTNIDTCVPTGVNGYDIPQKYRDLYARAMRGKSRKAAVRAHCLMCVGWNAAEVRLCTARNCPLFPYREVGVRRPRSDDRGADGVLVGSEAGLAV